MLTVGSLFTGIGGIDLAAEWAGMEIVWQCEIDPFCQKVLQKHWPGVKLYDDIRKIRGAERPDVIVGGFPCQPYSIAGKRAGKEDDRDLWPEMFRVIQELEPPWIVGENVANFVNMELERTLSNLEGESYETETFVLPACGVQAFHKRDRTFIVANSNSKFRKSLEIYSRTNKESERKEPKEWESFFFVNRGANNVEFREEDVSLLCRNDDGIPKKLDESRLKALGNAVVPQQIYPILKAIADIERGVWSE